MFSLLRQARIAVPLLVPLAFVGCSDNDDVSSSTANSIGQSLANRGYPTLQAAIDAAGLTDTLTNAGPFTVLAPSEAAFAALPAGTLDALLLPANQAALRDLLLYHVIDGTVDSAVVSSLDSAVMLSGEQVLIDGLGSDLYVNGSQVVAVDIAASNGIIHEIDAVLMPPQSIVDTLVAGGFDTLVSAVGAADLVTTLSGPGPFTVLAPTDAAFANLPVGVLDDLLVPANVAQLTDILTYHVVSGSVRASEALAAETPKALNDVTLLFASSGAGATVNEVTIRSINMPCTNGVLHVLDAVLIPAGDIPTVATQGGFDTLVAALTAAELVDDLQAPGPFTVFAPTEAAFAALPAGTLDTLLLPENQGMLIDLLLYHVVADELTAAEVLASTELTTLQGGLLPVDPTLVKVGGAGIAATNVLARNGIVHAIDTVLVPPTMSPLMQTNLEETFTAEDQSASGLALALSAPVGQSVEPLWFGDARSSDLRFEMFQGLAGQPLRPNADSGASLLGTGMAAFANSSGYWQLPLTGDLRVKLAENSTPSALQLDLRTSGAAALTAQLVVGYANGTSEAFDLRESAPWPNGDRQFVWDGTLQALEVRSAEVWISLQSQGTQVEGLRLHSLER